MGGLFLLFNNISLSDLFSFLFTIFFSGIITGILLIIKYIIGISIFFKFLYSRNNVFIIILLILASFSLYFGILKGLKTYDSTNPYEFGKPYIFGQKGEIYYIISIILIIIAQIINLFFNKPNTIQNSKGVIKR
jgi:hypothetical protein